MDCRVGLFSDHVGTSGVIYLNAEQYISALRDVDLVVDPDHEPAVAVVDECDAGCRGRPVDDRKEEEYPREDRAPRQLHSAKDKFQCSGQ